MDSSEYGAPLSNLPPLAWLSGINADDTGALSGEQQPSLGGGAPGTQMPGMGMEGGLGLDALSELLKSQQGGGENPPIGSMFQGIGGTIGQGTLAQGGPGYTIGGGGTVGQPMQTGQSGYTAGQTQGDTDPMALIRQALGVAGKAAGAFGQSGGYDSTPAESTSQLGNMGGQINPSGYSLTGQGAGSPDQLTQFFNSELGSKYLNDPTIMQLYTSGKLNGLLGDSNANTLQDFGTGGYSLSGQSPENIFSAPGGSAGFSLGGNNQLDTQLAGSTNWGGALQGGLGGSLGLLNLLQGLQSGNAQQGVSGGLQGASGLIGLLKSSPELASALGLSGDALGAAGTAAGGAGSALGLYGGIMSMLNGQYGPGATQIASALVSAYPAIASGINALGGSLGTAGGALSGGAGAAFGPVGLMAAGDPYGGGGAGVAASGATAALASLAGAGASTIGSVAGPVAPIVAFLIDYFGNQDTINAQRSWANRGAPVTQLKERAEGDISGANQMFDQLKQFGITDPNALMQALTSGSNALHGGYWSPQGSGSNPYTINEYFKHTGEDRTAYDAQQLQLENSLWSTIQQLHAAGVTPEQFGALNVNPLWGEGHLGGTPVLGNIPGRDLAGLGMMNPGQAAMATGGWLSPTNTNTATGGPLMSMIAALNPALYGQIGGGFNYTDPAIQEELRRQQEYSDMINAQAYQEFTSAGGGPGGDSGF